MHTSAKTYHFFPPPPNKYSLPLLLLLAIFIVPQTSHAEKKAAEFEESLKEMHEVLQKAKGSSASAIRELMDANAQKMAEADKERLSLFDSSKTRAMRGVFLRMHHRALASGWNQWQAGSTDARRKYFQRKKQDKMRKRVLRRMVHSALCRSWGRWQFRTRQARRVRGMLFRWKSRRVAMIFDAWSTVVARAKEARRLEEERKTMNEHRVYRALQRMQHKSLAKTFDTWLDVSRWQRRGRTILKKVIGRLANQNISGAWGQWHTVFTQAKWAEEAARQKEEAANEAARRASAKAATAAGRVEAEMNRVMEEMKMRLQAEADKMAADLELAKNQVEEAHVQSSKIAKEFSAAKVKWEQDKQKVQSAANIQSSRKLLEQRRALTGEHHRAMSMRTINMARHSSTSRNLRTIRNTFTSWRYVHVQSIRLRESSLLETFRKRLEIEQKASMELFESEQQWKAVLVIQHKLYYRWKVRKERRNQGGSMRNFLEYALKSERAKREQVESSLRAELEENKTILQQKHVEERQRQAAMVLQHKLFHCWKVRKERRNQGGSMRNFLEQVLRTERAKREEIVSSLETSALREAQKKQEEFQEKLDKSTASLRQEAEMESARALGKQTDKHEQYVRQILREKEGEMRRAVSMRTIVLARHSGTARSQRMVRRVFSSWKFESDRAVRKAAEDQIQAAANESLVRLAELEDVNGKLEALTKQANDLKHSKETLEQSSLDASKAFEEIVQKSDSDHEKRIAAWEKKLEEAALATEQQQALHSEETASLEMDIKAQLESAVAEALKRERELAAVHSRAMSMRTVKMMRHFILSRNYRSLRRCFRAWHAEFHRPRKQALLAAKVSAAVVARAEETVRVDVAESVARMETELEMMGAENRQREARMRAKAANFFASKSKKMTWRQNQKLKLDVLYAWVSSYGYCHVCMFKPCI